MSNDKTTPERRPWPFTLQQSFDRALFGIRKQGYRKSEALIDGEDYTCAYKGEAGCRCAFGHMVPDEDLDVVSDRYEGVAAFAVIDAMYVVSDDPQENIPSLAMHVQDLHDQDLDPRHPDVWEDGMHALARLFDLNYTPPEKGNTTKETL